MPKTASRGHRPTVSLSSAFGWHVWSISVQSHVEGAERRQLARRRVLARGAQRQTAHGDTMAGRWRGR